MAIKKAVHRRSFMKDSLWSRTKKKLHKSTDFVKRQHSELLLIFSEYKTTTKVVVASVLVGVFLFVLYSVTNSLNTLSGNQKTIDDLDREIELQIEKNDTIERQIKGDMDEIIERKAHEELNMVYPDEEIYINNAG